MSFQEIYLFVRGPLATVSFVVFFLEVIYQICLFFRYTKRHKKKEVAVPLYLQEELKKNPVPSRKRLFSLEFDPILAVVTTIFHVLLIITPVFLLAHNILIYQSWNFSLPSLRESLADVFTITVLLLGLFLFFRRIFLKKVRIISDFGDFLLFFLVYLPFLTGFLAYHQIFYKPMIIAHILLGELMLVCIPFTRLKHMIFLVLNRIFIRSEYSFLTAGKRVYGHIKKI